MFVQVLNVVLLFTLFMYYVDESFTSDSLDSLIPMLITIFNVCLILDLACFASTRTYLSTENVS